MRYILTIISLFLFLNAYSQTDKAQGTTQVKKSGVFDRGKYGNYSPVDTVVVDGKVFRIILPEKYKCSLYPKFMGSKLILTNHKNIWSDYYVISFNVGKQANGAYAEGRYVTPELHDLFSKITAVGTEIYITFMKGSTVDEKKMSIPEFKILRIK